MLQFNFLRKVDVLLTETGQRQTFVSDYLNQEGI